MADVIPFKTRPDAPIRAFRSDNLTDFGVDALLFGQTGPNNPIEPRAHFGLRTAMDMARGSDRRRSALERALKSDHEHAKECAKRHAPTLIEQANKLHGAIDILRSVAKVIGECAQTDIALTFIDLATLAERRGAELEARAMTDDGDAA